MKAVGLGAPRYGFDTSSRRPHARSFARGAFLCRSRKVPWGTGDVPIKEVLQWLKREKHAIVGSGTITAAPQTVVGSEEVPRLLQERARIGPSERSR